MFISQNRIVYGFLDVIMMTSRTENILTTFFESSRVPCLDIFMFISTIGVCTTPYQLV